MKLSIKLVGGRVGGWCRPGSSETMLCTNITRQLWPGLGTARTIRATVRTVADDTCWERGEELFELVRCTDGIWAIRDPGRATCQAYWLLEAAQDIVAPFVADGPCRVLVNLRPLTT